MSLLVQYFWAIFALLVGKEMICVFGKKMDGWKKKKKSVQDRKRERERERDKFVFVSPTSVT